jgi:hypothetical protein
MPMASAEAQAAAAELGLGPEYAGWLAVLDQAGGDDAAGPPLTSPSDAVVLERAGVTAQDAAVVLATQADLGRSPGLQWLLRRARQLITAVMGDPAAPRVLLPPLPAALGDAGRCFPAHLFLATWPLTLDWQRQRGVPDEVSWAIVADLGRQMEIYRDRYGATGVEEAWWLTLHLRGQIYEFGRLQYNLLRLGDGWLAPARWYPLADALGRGTGFRPGDEALGVHIPDGGPLTPAACEASLLDDQLAGYLPARANIVQFQRRFTLTPGWDSGDKDVAQFVFRRAVAELGTVPQRTTLQRAIISHLRTGGHWRLRTGWLTL